MPDITHEQAKKWIQAAVDGGVPASARKIMEAHLAGCADCAGYAGDTATLDSHLRRVIRERAELSRDLETVPLRIYSQLRRKTMHKPMLNNLKYYVLVPLLLLVIVGLFYRFLPGWIGQKQTGVGAGVAKTPSLGITQLITITPPIGETPVLSASISPTVIPGSISVTANGVTLTLTSVRREADLLSIRICFDLPSNGDWVVGHSSPTTLTAGEYHSGDIGGSWIPSSYTKGSQRCTDIDYPAPVEVSLKQFTITVNRLESIPGNGYEYDCVMAQKRLDDANSGIVVSCFTIETDPKIEKVTGPSGWDYDILTKPDGMSDSQARTITDKAFVDVIEGPWVFTTGLPDNPPGVTVINYFGISLSASERIKTFIPEFRSLYPNIDVRVSEVVTGDFSEPGMFHPEAIVEQYDCFADISGSAINYKTGILYPDIISLSPYMAAEESSFVEDFYPNIKDRDRVEGEMYGLLTAVQPYVMFYNPELLAKRKLQTPQLDWSFEDFIKLIVAASSTSEDEKSFGFYLDNTGIDFLFAGHDATAGYDPLAEFPTVNFESPEMVSSIAWLADLYESGALEIPSDQWGPYPSDPVVFWVQYPVVIESTPSSYVSVVPLPSAPGINRFYSTYGGISQYISRRAKDPQACWEWIRFLTKKLPFVYNGVPARKSVALSTAWENQVGKKNATAYRFALEQINKSKIGPPYLLYSLQVPLERWRMEAIINTLKGEDSQKALTSIQQKAVIYLSCMKDAMSMIDEQEFFKKMYSCAKQADPGSGWGQ